MLNVSDNAANLPAVSILDPDLPFLASRAAIELDNLLLAQPSSLSAVQDLGKRLREATELRTSGSDCRTLMDPPTVSAISDALSAVGSVSVKSLSELAAEAHKVAGDLQGCSPGQERQLIERARLFCLTLSQLATSYQQSVYDSDPVFMQRR